MVKWKTKLAISIILASAASLALTADTASAWTHRRKGYPSFNALRFYSSPQRPVRYYRACGYGDCPCLRSIALATRARVWWDRYEACTG